MQTIWLMPNTCFPSGSLGFWYVLGRGCLCDQPPVNTLVLDLKGASLVENVLHVLPQLGGMKHVLCVSLGRELLEACAWSPPAFPCANFAQHPFTIIGVSCGYDCMWAAASPPSKSLIPGVLGTPNIGASISKLISSSLGSCRRAVPWIWDE